MIMEKCAKSLREQKKSGKNTIFKPTVRHGPRRCFKPPGVSNWAMLALKTAAWTRLHTRTLTIVDFSYQSLNAKKLKS